MRTGHMRTRVTFQRASEAQSASGEPIKTWVDLTTVWAKVTPMSGTEAVRAGLNLTDAPALIEVRHSTTLATLSAKDRAKIGTTVYDLKPPADVESRKRTLEITGVARG